MLLCVCVLLLSLSFVVVWLLLLLLLLLFFVTNERGHTKVLDRLFTTLRQYETNTDAPRNYITSNKTLS